MEREPQPQPEQLTWTQRRLEEAMDGLLSVVGESNDSVSETNPQAVAYHRQQFERIILDVLRETGALPLNDGDNSISRWLGF